MSYDGLFGFMGLFIMRRDQRGRGLGAQLWRYRLSRLQGRLAPGAAIGMDGVLAMKPFYERGGFVFAHNDVRYQGVADGTMDPAVRPIDSSMFAIVETFDRSHVPAPRASFLRRWIFQPGAHALALHENGQLAGYGVARPALKGYKLGPVFAKRADIAERLVSSLMACIPGEQVQLDVPEPNQSGSRLAEKFGLKEVFGCARLYHGRTPELADWQHIRRNIVRIRLEENVMYHQVISQCTQNLKALETCLDKAEQYAAAKKFDTRRAHDQPPCPGHASFHLSGSERLRLRESGSGLAFRTDTAPARG